MNFDEFNISYGAANKVVKQDLKKGKDLDNIGSKEALEQILIGLLKRRFQL